MRADSGQWRRGVPSHWHTLCFPWRLLQVVWRTRGPGRAGLSSPCSRKSAAGVLWGLGGDSGDPLNPFSASSRRLVWTQPPQVLCSKPWHLIGILPALQSCTTASALCLSQQGGDPQPQQLLCCMGSSTGRLLSAGRLGREVFQSMVTPEITLGWGLSPHPLSDHGLAQPRLFITAHLAAGCC